MAEIPSSPSKYLNQFKNRNVSVVDISGDVTNMMQNVADTLGTITGSITVVSQSLRELTNTVTTQSVQISELVEMPKRVVNSSKIYVNKEIPTGNTDGINTTYVLSHEPTLGSEHLYLNGVLIEEGTETDYSISGSVIVFDNPLLEGMKLHCTYYYDSSAAIKLFKDKEIPAGTIDGINTEYSLLYTPVEGSEHIYLNGVLQESGGQDYIIRGKNLTFSDPIPLNSKLRCTYYYEI
jgi:hypothetical protein